QGPFRSPAPADSFYIISHLFPFVKNFFRDFLSCFAVWKVRAAALPDSFHIISRPVFNVKRNFAFF
ncbi:MAG: hypothetical protein ACLRWF_04070, partial [Ruthenibacterium sp.]